MTLRIRLAFVACMLPVALSFAHGAMASAGEKLMLVGGGDIPAPALTRFCEWAGGPQAHVQVITWATSHPAESFTDFSSKLAFCHPARVEASPDPQMTVTEKAAFLKQLAGASAIFFTGGDQNRIMSVLADPDLARILKDLYLKGVPVGGTSAGTAIMSPLMLTGTGDWTVIDDAAAGTAPGLGLLAGVVLDTHFVRRQRENRLFSVVLSHPELVGVGIDEDTALIVRDGRFAEVSGRGQVLILNARRGERDLRVKLLRAGARVEL